MASRTPHPERVDPARARLALSRANNDRSRAYSRYIQLTFQQTGNLAPGCDNRDLLAWYAANVPTEAR